MGRSAPQFSPGSLLRLRSQIAVRTRWARLRDVWQNAPDVARASRVRLSQALGSDGPSSLTLASGHRVAIRRGTSDTAVFRQVFVERHYELPFGRSLHGNGPALIVDTGANVGFSTLFFSQRFPFARIIAIEPDPGNFAALEQNVAGIATVTTMRAALWWRREPLASHDPGIGEWGYQVRPGTDSAIPVVTLEELTAAEQRVDLLKLDIEGAELELFSHASGWIDRVDAIAVELHERIRPGVTDVFEAATKDFARRIERGEITFVSRA